MTFSVPDRFNAAAYFIDPHLRERSDKIAIECGDERVTYRELVARVNRLGNALRRALGVRVEERVLLLLLDTPDFAACFFGAIKIGAVPAPVNTFLKPAEYEYLLNDSRARVAIVSEALLPLLAAIPRHRLPSLEHVVVVGGPIHGAHSFSELISAEPAELDPAPTHLHDPAFWLYSSGSTGFPKGCVHLQHDMVVTSELYAKQILQVGEHDRFFSVAKLFFAYGLGNGLYFPLAVGGASILLPGPAQPASVFDIIERHRPTLFFSVPSSYAALLAHRRDGCDFDLSSIRNAISAGEALPAAIFQRFESRFGVEILDAIGSTEALHMFIANRPGAAHPGSSGQVIPGMDARIVDEGGRAVSTGEVGNLYIRSDAVCSCYWNQHEKTKDAIDGHWLRTGDKYRQDADGYFWYAGRTDDMLKVSGVWVSPAEIESTLVEHPAVQEAAVVGRKDQDELVKPAAYVVLHAGHVPAPDLAQQLQEFVATRLAAYKRPRWVEFLPELPKTATGKIQRFKLRCPAGV
ncbi:MAG: benzoate-CoA ligase family protein [Acidobacteriia bacterium]|nr:benzoate-CoA ligase family protein [Terriglobia bacterium]